MTVRVNNSPESADAVDTAAPDQHMTTTQENSTIQEGKGEFKWSSWCNKSGC